MKLDSSYSWLAIGMVVAGGAVGCGRATLSNPPGDDGGPTADAAPAVDSRTHPCQSWTRALYFDPCALPDPGGELVISAQLGPYTIDTDSGTLVGADGAAMPVSSAVLDGPQPIRAISATSVWIEPNAYVRVQGSLPLVIASWSSASVDGVIDVSSNAAVAGAGANGPACDISGGQPGTPTGGRGDGGGGGGFSAPGGDGGISTGPGAAGGAATPVPQALRGGCPGGDGADGDQLQQNRGRGGAGGGGLLIAALEEVAVQGAIHAGGAGGGGGLAGHGGGGGGGSGGLIALAAPRVAITAPAIIAANGGGGGGGGGGSAPGESGQDGLPESAPAAGGNGPNGVGGVGGVVDRMAGGAGQGGGGGGGGTGYIVIAADELAMDGTAQLSPAPVTQQ